MSAATRANGLPRSSGAGELAETVLVAYASTHGHTEAVAKHLAEAMDTAGVPTFLHRLTDGDELDPAPFAAVVLAGSVHTAGHQPYLVHWAREHRATLKDRGLAFISVSLNAADPRTAVRTEAQENIEIFSKLSEWSPPRTLAVAGALAYTRYSPTTRTLMRGIARQAGLPTDTSRDHAFTDWEAVARFGRELASRTPASGKTR